jgi:hypothetical protein
MPEWEDLGLGGDRRPAHPTWWRTALGYAGKWVSGEIVRHDCVRDFVGLTPPVKSCWGSSFWAGRPMAFSPPAQRSPIEDKVSWRW